MDKVHRINTVSEKTGLPKSTIYWMIAKNLFPKQIKLSARSVGWLESEVNAWIEQRTNQSRLCGGTK